MKTSIFRSKLLFAFALLIISAIQAAAQTTAFTYQGKLNDASMPANSTYDFEFALFDALTAGTQIGSQTVAGVTVTNGIFTVQLNFGAAAFPGANRFLEIRVKKPSDASYTTLAPRQPVTSTPYAIRSLNAGTADTATNATNAANAANADTLDGTDSSGFVATNTNAFIRNQTTPQTDAKFNIDGNGTLGGTLQANAVTAQTATGNYGLRHTDGTTTIGTYVGGSGSGAAGGWLGTLTNQPLHFFTNGGQPRMTIDTLGNVGIGTFTPTFGKLQVNNAGNDPFAAIYGLSSGVNGTGVAGESNGSGSAGVYGSNRSQDGLAGRFDGNVLVLGDLQVNLLKLTRLGVAGGTPLCQNSANLIAACSSSLRYKKDFQTFFGGLNIINQLRPISYKWKTNDEPDVGFGAEDVAKINPLFVTYNDKGEVEGVKYDRLSVVFVNAIKEQQTQIETHAAQIEEQRRQLQLQQLLIDGLRKLVCSQNPQAEVCKERIK